MTESQHPTSANTSAGVLQFLAWCHHLTPCSQTEKYLRLREIYFLFLQELCVPQGGKYRLKTSKTQSPTSKTLIYYSTSLHVSACFSFIIGRKILTYNVIAIQCILPARMSYKMLTVDYTKT